jgi:hypothetical protein
MEDGSQGHDPSLPTTSRLASRVAIIEADGLVAELPPRRQLRRESQFSRLDRDGLGSGLKYRQLTLSATEVAGIHASTMVLSRVGIPLLRFHLHPS